MSHLELAKLTSRKIRSISSMFQSRKLALSLVTYLIASTFLLLGTLAGIFYYWLGDLIVLTAQLTDLEVELGQIFARHLSETVFWVVGAITAYIGFNFCVGIYCIHKILGPSQAFSRHIQQLRSGNYDAKTTLRKGDALHNVASELNSLSKDLDSKKKNPNKGSLTVVHNSKESPFHFSQAMFRLSK